ncbi:hypothetical protein DFH09DRAFT_1070531 [Mycena vulgaris]|nr:hypothetical protein DFH09DRAFT_1070531 [Mycena vulgaris]
MGGQEVRELAPLKYTRKKAAKIGLSRAEAGLGPKLKLKIGARGQISWIATSKRRRTHLDTKSLVKKCAQDEQDKGLELLKAAWDVGINMFDTANMCVQERLAVIPCLSTGNHRTRSREKPSHNHQDSLHQCPDLGSRAAFDPSTPNTCTSVTEGGLSCTAIFNKVDPSLAHLTMSLDVLMLHATNNTVPVDEAARTPHDPVPVGKVQYLCDSESPLRNFGL